MAPHLGNAVNHEVPGAQARANIRMPAGSLGRQVEGMRASSVVTMPFGDVDPPMPHQAAM